MVQTSKFLTVTDTWANVPLNGAVDISITLEAPYKDVKVVVSDTQPPQTQTFGNTITSLARTAAITGLLANQKVWVRTIGDSSSVTYQ